MKIAGQDNITAIRGAAQAEAASGSRTDAGTTAGASAEFDAAGSSLTLSPRSEDAGRIADLARSAPEFRVDKVEQARADLASGAMQPDPMAIATQMAQELF